MFKDWLGCVHTIINAVDSSINIECLGHEWVPVVEMVEFNIDPVVILEGFIEKHLGLVKEQKVVVGQVLDVVFNSKFERFSYKRTVYVVYSAHTVVL